MISIKSSLEPADEVTIPTFDVSYDETIEVSACEVRTVREPTTERTFDLFAEARQIYARARSNQRIRSSHII